MISSSTSISSSFFHQLNVHFTGITLLSSTTFSLSTKFNENQFFIRLIARNLPVTIDQYRSRSSPAFRLYRDWDRMICAETITDSQIINLDYVEFSSTSFRFEPRATAPKMITDSKRSAGCRSSHEATRGSIEDRGIQGSVPAGRRSYKLSRAADDAPMKLNDVQPEDIQRALLKTTPPAPGFCISLQ